MHENFPWEMEGLIPLLTEPESLSFYSTMFPTLQWNRIGQSQLRGCRKHLQNFLCPGRLLSVWYPRMSKDHIDRSLATTYASVCPCRHSAAAPKSYRRKHRVRGYTRVASSAKAWGCNPTTCNPLVRLEGQAAEESRQTELVEKKAWLWGCL